MSKAIVYSFYSVPENPENSPTFVMLQYSLETLRNHNPDILVLLYVYNTKERDVYHKTFGHINNLEIKFKTYTPPENLSKIHMLMMEHKWASVFDALEKYQAVLFTDCDTVFFDDPDLLFIKYNDPTKVYTRGSLLGGDFLKFFKIKNLVMNDGQFLIRDYFLKDKQTFLDARINYMLDKIKELNKMEVDEKEYENIYSWINWSGSQYGITLLLHNINAFQEFAAEDVSLFTDLVSINDKEDLVLLHYFNYNIHHVLPKKYLNKISKKVREDVKKVQEEWVWDV